MYINGLTSLVLHLKCFSADLDLRLLGKTSLAKPDNEGTSVKIVWQLVPAAYQ